MNRSTLILQKQNRQSLNLSVEDDNYCSVQGGFILYLAFSSYILVFGEDIGVTYIKDRKNGAVEELSASGSKSDVVTGVVVDRDLSKHGHVLNFGLSQVRAVGGDEDQLGLSLSD